MTVAELIAILQTQDQTLRVVVRGYEGGVNDVGGCTPVLLILDAHRGSSYMGRHEDLFDRDMYMLSDYPEHKTAEGLKIHA